MVFKQQITITVEEEKNLQPYLGKYILRDGDLHAEMLTMDLVCRYLYTSRFLKNLEQTGLLFDTWEEAERTRELLVLTLKRNKIGGLNMKADEWKLLKVKKRPKMLSMFYALLLCLFYVALAIGVNILSHKLLGLYCGIDSITFSMVFTIVWVLCYIYITED